jgi:hypothetical protein
MIEELVDDGESEPDNKGLDDPYIPKDTFTRASYMTGCQTVISSSKRMRVLKRTYVYHGSTRAIP